MEIKTVDRIADIPANAWNVLVEDRDPLLRHELFAAFEETGCAVPQAGWLPRHLAVTESGKIIGAAPIYMKGNTYGEFVFDFAWAEAYHRAGLRYFPKLISAIPFTPVAGPRLLIADRPDRANVERLLIEGATELARRSNASSMHWLFPHAADVARLEHHGLMRRDGLQYHWLNPGYRDFEDFLSTLNAKKRKQIRRERRHVREAGIEIEVVDGRAISGAQWDLMHDFHQATIGHYGAPPFLTRAFFHRTPSMDAIGVVGRKFTACISRSATTAPWNFASRADSGASRAARAGNTSWPEASLQRRPSRRTGLRIHSSRARWLTILPANATGLSSISTN